MDSTGSNSSVQDTEAGAARADLVLALTSYNDAGTIGAVVRALQQGVARSFAAGTVRFVLADAGSTDGTADTARGVIGASALEEVPVVPAAGLAEVPYHGQPARAAALRGILQAAQRLNATACAVIDASVQTVEPDWIERLVGPVVTDGYDYVSPYYARRMNEGAITKSIIYPLFRALYGVRLRQPAAGEFGCSARLIAHCLEQDFWDADQAPVGIDLWLAIAAVTGGLRTCEAALGVRTASAHRSPADLSTTLAQLVDALFSDLEHRADVWQRVRGSVPIPIAGRAAAGDPDPPALDVEGLMESFRLGYRELREIWTWVLPPRTIVELRRLTESAPERFRFDDRLWAGIIYDFALGYGFHVLPRAHLLRSLTPLYTGWLASFIVEMRGATLGEVEERIERVCEGFELEKRYLISRWRWPERLR